MSPLRPLLRRWAGRATAADREAPLAAGPRRAARGGPDPDRVLVLGSGPASGKSPEGATAPLPAALSAALSARTGRGAVVEAHGRPHATVEDVATLLADAQLGRFDAVVLVVGMADAAAGAPAGRWRRRLGELVATVQREAPRGAVVLLTRIPPASSTVLYRGPRALLADLRLRAFNRGIARIARTGADVGVSEVPPPAPGDRLGSAGWYRACGERLAADLAPLLAAGR